MVGKMGGFGLFGVVFKGRLSKDDARLKIRKTNENCLNKLITLLIS
ncbi:hypothetical protein AZO1586R_1836 [Bathymodiolus azoricus thioautotrophic gill symbiont]|uniref:Uncharacterized protein n=1 Tax=Bathymodiolus azoricus thioautotrophic gill symbiont TaxID=235205 RepID=A0ACA8ZS86_9GAMM|nr:hypothetical protein AZO1586R_1836 [Bathymodiolus azoricus thioautotrophic gill symbiont]